MNNFAKVLWPYYRQLAKKIENNDFLIDKSGCKIVELIAPRIVFTIENENEQGYVDFENRKSPRKYLEKETQWYHSMSLDINSVSDVKIWTEVADDNHQINSNYGYLVFSKGNFSQYSHCLETLKKHKDSRQAIIIYTRPSIQLEHNDLNGHDFICTNYNQFFIRNNQLIDIVSMRSNDCIFGIGSDIPWFTSVYQKMMKDLKEFYPDLDYGEMIFIPNSFHCYERHFELLKKIADEE